MIAPTQNVRGFVESSASRRSGQHHTHQSQANEWSRQGRLWGSAQHLALRQHAASWRALLRSVRQTPFSLSQRTQLWLCSWAIVLSVRSALGILRLAERLLPPWLRAPTALCAIHPDLANKCAQAPPLTECSGSGLGSTRRPRPKIQPDHPLRDASVIPGIQALQAASRERINRSGGRQ